MATELNEVIELTTISTVDTIYPGVIVPPEKKFECEDFLNKTHKSYPKGMMTNKHIINCKYSIYIHSPTICPTISLKYNKRYKNIANKKV